MEYEYEEKEYEEEELIDYEILMEAAMVEEDDNANKFYLFWSKELRKLSNEASRISGFSDILYVKNFSDSVNAFVADLDEDTKSRVLFIAETDFDYCENPEVCSYEGFCSHGIEIDCCPLGCGEGDV